ncbi:hypothetical protein HMPREF3225_01417 [Staphylococcus lugdunensis]|uniref:Uncharacterized protein n=1 Tax=Staphylococcus lugdunensis TaxID=28035 RepID=A0ABD4EFH2_STALU|nr:hypothetical protein HMPREF3225_01417 [Staphylococcus lugdunensis]
MRLIVFSFSLAVSSQKQKINILTINFISQISESLALFNS